MTIHQPGYRAQPDRTAANQLLQFLKHANMRRNTQRGGEVGDRIAQVSGLPPTPGSDP